MAKTKSVQIALPPGVAAYAWLAKPDDKFPKNGKPVFKVTVLVDGDTDISNLEDTCVNAAKEKFPGVKPAEFRMPFGPDEKGKEEFEGKILIRLSTVYQPYQCDALKNALPDGVSAKSGDLIRCAATVFPYESIEKVREGGKTVTVKAYGVSLQLAAVQLLEKRTGGGGAATADALFDEDADGYVGSTVDDTTDDTSADAGRDF